MFDKIPLISATCFVAVNIAVALAKEFKLKVGLLDADIYGPSIPTMMHLHEKPEVSEGITISCTSLNICRFAIQTCYIVCLKS